MGDLNVDRTMNYFELLTNPFSRPATPFPSFETTTDTLLTLLNRQRILLFPSLTLIFVTSSIVVINLKSMESTRMSSAQTIVLLDAYYS